MPESTERSWEWDSCEPARSTAVFANWYFLLFQCNFVAGLQEYVVEGENSVVWEAVTHRQSSKIALMYPWIHSCDLQTARDEPTGLAISHVPFVFPLLPCPSLISILHLSHPSFNRWFSSTEILNLILKQKNHPIFPTYFLSSLSSLLPVEVFEVAQVPEKGIFFSLFVLWLCVPSSLYLPFVILFCLPRIYASPHLFTLLQGSFFINMLISSPGIFLASHRSPGRARRDEGREGRRRWEQDSNLWWDRTRGVSEGGILHWLVSWCQD